MAPSRTSLATVRYLNELVRPSSEEPPAKAGADGLDNCRRGPRRRADRRAAVGYRRREGDGRPADPRRPRRLRALPGGRFGPHALPAAVLARVAGGAGTGCRRDRADLPLRDEPGA